MLSDLLFGSFFLNVASSKKEQTTELEGSGLQTRISILEDENARLHNENQTLKAFFTLWHRKKTLEIRRR
jgi:hypothetical protein